MLLKIIENHKDKIITVEKYGSAIKACRIAQGLAEVSFRLGSNTKEWDTAAFDIIVREAGAEVLGVASIFTYGMKKGLDRLAEANVKNISLTNFDVIAQIAADENYIKPDDVERLIKFRNNPSDESWIK